VSYQDDEVRSLERRLAELARRVDRLEAGVPRESPVPPASEPTAADLSIVEQLRTRRGSRYRAPDMRGALIYAGAATLGDRESLWVKEHPLPEIIELEPDRLAAPLSALGHPSRLILLRALVREPRSSARLQEILGVSSPGQLYHHLKDLVATGLVRQTARGQYEVSDRQVIPLLAALAAVSDLVDSIADPRAAD
jgi:DNA-binding transcriptional ArsR family regulator